MVFIGTNMRGMSEDDVPAVARALNDGTHADEVMEVLEQGLSNYISLVHAMRTTLAQQLFVEYVRQGDTTGLDLRSGSGINAADTVPGSAL